MYRLSQQLQTFDIRKRRSNGRALPARQKFATEELTCPKRTVCTTVATVFDDYPVLPVRTETEIPKDKIPALMELVNNFTLKKRVARGEVVIENVLDTGVNLISTSNMLYDYFVKI